MVASIGGEWRYVDCIAKNAGKGRAMVYLASKFGIALEDVVAAGDSGNDLLMLGKLHEGHHPAIVMSNSHPEVCMMGPVGVYGCEGRLCTTFVAILLCSQLHILSDSNTTDCN